MSVSLKKEEVTPHSREKRKAMQQDGQWEKRNTEPTPIDGQAIPDPAEGWVPDRPTTENEHLYVACVRSLRFTDGSTRRYYQILVRPAEVAAMKKQAKRAARRIKRENEVAAKKSAKRAVREFLVRIGKI